MDPVKVTRSALQNGASVACLLLTTEAMVADLPEKKKGGDDHHHGVVAGHLLEARCRGRPGPAVSVSWRPGRSLPGTTGPGPPR